MCIQIIRENRKWLKLYLLMMIDTLRANQRPSIFDKVIVDRGSNAKYNREVCHCYDFNNTVTFHTLYTIAQHHCLGGCPVYITNV